MEVGAGKDRLDMFVNLVVSRQIGHVGKISLAAYELVVGADRCFDW